MKPAVFACLMILCFSASAQVRLNKKDLEELKDRMVGIFDNQEQSRADFSFQAIVLHAVEVELKGKQPEGFWLYMEQALASTPEQPYRQQILRLYKKNDDTLAAVPYMFMNPGRVAGAWNSTGLFKKLGLDSLVEQPGCTVYFYKDGEGRYHGATRGAECACDINGAVYMSSQVTVYPNLITSRDQGWDAAGGQAWATSSPGYKLRKFTSPRKPKDD